MQKETKARNKLQLLQTQTLPEGEKFNRVSRKAIEDENQEVYTISYNFNYKLDGKYAVKPSQAFSTTMVLGTGEGPNFVATRALPVGWEGCISKTETVRLRAPNSQAESTHGFIPLWIGVRNFSKKDTFLVCDQLSVPLFFGEQFIDGNVAITRHEHQTANVSDGYSAPLVRQKTSRCTL